MEDKLKTVIVYYSKHHRNTQLLVDAIKKREPEVELMDVTKVSSLYLRDFDRIGIASGIYYSKFAKPLMQYLNAHLPENKKVFSLYTCGTMNEKYTKGIKALVKERNCEYIGEYGCLGFDTFGPFKLMGGISKGHPNASEIQGAIDFYKGLDS
ncbi:MAG: flavodoxin [Lachnospiraceae bacterium]|nr:flavodoxin [Lachnospiraceae bacterium]